MRELPDLLRMQRLALVDALETLAPEEWAWPSLCAGWTVQDMAAHLAWTPPMRPQELAAGVLRSGLQLHRLNDDNARRWSARGWDAVLRQLRTNAEQGLRPPGTPARAALTDAVVHAVDILRPLGRSVPLDPTAFRVVADFSAGLPWPPPSPSAGHGGRCAASGWPPSTSRGRTAPVRRSGPPRRHCSGC